MGLDYIMRIESSNIKYGAFKDRIGYELCCDILCVKEHFFSADLSELVKNSI